MVGRRESPGFSYGECHILNYFGEPFTPPCNTCDNCLAGIYLVENPAEEPFPLNSQVIHPSFGEGLVTRYEGDKIVVLFDSVGYKTLALDVVRENGLLTPAGGAAGKGVSAVGQ